MSRAVISAARQDDQKEENIMGQIVGGKVIEGALGPILVESAPVNGTNEVQNLEIGGTPTGGSFKLSFDGYTTAAISWSATNATLISNIDTALEALANIGSGEVTVADVDLSSGIGNVSITFSGNLGKLNVPSVAVASNDMEGSSPTAAITVTTAGVDATARGAPKGATVLDITNGKGYINNGTALAPDWIEESGIPDSIGVISETVAIGDFTDNEDTTGYVDLSEQLPAGAIPLGWKAVVSTGFTGDTSAVLQAGVSGDLDRFSAVTDQSVLAAGTVGASSLGQSDVLDGIGGAQSIRLTVTGAADFSSISAGELTFYQYYLRTV